MARIPKNTVALTPGGAITKDMVLGYLAMFTVPDKPVSAATLRKLWHAEGLQDIYDVPKNRRSVNAFQVACRSIETRRHTNGAEKRAEVKVDEVLENQDTCVYQITHMVRDREHRVIEHEKSMRVVFNKESEAIKVERLEKQAYETLRPLAESIREHYERNAKKVPGAKLRAAIRAILDDMGATNVRKKAGGIYFTPRDGLSRLESLKNVLEGLHGDDAELHLIPLANDEGQRALIERHFSMNVADEFAELQADVTTRLREGTGIRSDRLNNIINRRRELEAHAERYRTLLDSNLSFVAEQGTLLDEQIEALVTKVGTTL